MKATIPYRVPWPAPTFCALCDLFFGMVSLQGEDRPFRVLFNGNKPAGGGETIRFSRSQAILLVHPLWKDRFAGVHMSLCYVWHARQDQELIFALISLESAASPNGSYVVSKYCPHGRFLPVIPSHSNR